MLRRLAPIAIGLAAAVLAVAAPGAARAQSDGNGLEEISVNTFRIDPEAGFVRVDVTISLRNVTTDRRDGDVIRQRYFDGYGVVVPAGAENIEARSSGGRVLDGEWVSDPTTEAFALFQFDLADDLYSGESTTVTVSYDHRGLPPRSAIPWRSNAAYISLVAFGGGDTGDVSIELVLPAGYALDDFSDVEEFVRQPPDEFGTVTYRAEGLDEDFGALISVSNDDRLVSTPVDVDGASFVIESWPGDEEWITFTRDHLTVGVPGLAALIGSDWPVDEQLAIRETVEPAFAGYAGWFDARASEIAVGEELDAETVFHELSHAWFNDDRFPQRWLTEGFAQTYASEMVRADGDEAREPPAIDKSDPNRQPLSTWTVSDAEEYEDYGYAASWFVVDAIVDEIGFDAARDVLAAGEDPTSLVYGDPGRRGPDSTRRGWERWYDLFELVGGSTVVDELFRAHVLDDAGQERLDERSAARVAYSELERAAAPWSMPVGVREAMNDWVFHRAEQRMDAAAEVVERRGQVEALERETGVRTADLAAAPFADAVADFEAPLQILERQLAAGNALVELQSEIAALAKRVEVVMPALGGARYEDEVDDFGDAVGLGRDQLDALARVAAAIDAEAGADDLLSRIGLVNTDIPGALDEARAALEAGDAATARARAAEVQAVLASADDTGRGRALVAAVAVALLLLVTVGLMVDRRRRRMRRRRSGGGAVDAEAAAGQLGGRPLDLDEDALAGARLGGVDHRVDVAAGDPGQAARAARVVERAPALGHVRDPVLELDEDIGAVVDAQPVAGAEVLIDPDAHDEAER